MGTNVMETQMILARLAALMYVSMFLYVGTVFGGQGPRGEMQLKLEIETSKARYLVGLPVVAYVSFENLGNDLLILNTAFNVFPECSLTFNILDPSNEGPIESLPPLGKRQILNKGDFVRLKKGKRFKTEIEISKWYKLKRVGVYRISAEYKNIESGNKVLGDLKAWTGRVASGSVSFVIEDAGRK